ncbi:MAG: DUF1565 domain-containing protein [Candidatus Coatesbacteria bacterium]|nr:DUF1565 domain-containing protein [Candidatus Coatesbacteria bacterium]
MKRTFIHAGFATTASFVAMMFTAALAGAAPGPKVGVFTDNDAYACGETIEVSLSAENDGEGMSVALYVGLLTPDGGIYTTQFDGWSDRLEPWIPEAYLPPGFSMVPTPFWRFDLPCVMPPISAHGQYNFATILSRPGTLEWASDLSLAPFALGGTGADCYVDAIRGSDDGDGSGLSPWRTITHALTSVEGSQAQPVAIHVAAGAYSASANGEGFPLEMKGWVSLIGEGEDITTLDAQAASGVIDCRSVEGVIIEGFTITGGMAQSGAGIYCELSSPSIKHNTISGNAACGGA